MLSLKKIRNKHKLIYALGLVTMGLFMAPNPAKAVTFEYKSGFTDDDFNALISSGDYIEEFVAQSQIGNNAWQTKPLSGDTELQLFDIVYDPNSSAPALKKNFGVATSGQFDFDSGKAVDFSLEVKGSNVKYTVGGQELVNYQITGAFTDLFLRTRANNFKIDKNNNNQRVETLSNSVLLSDLKLIQNGKVTNISSFGSASSQNATKSSDVDYLLIGDLVGDFTLTGKSTLFFEFNPQNINTVKGAELAYQIKGGSLKKQKTVPEPGTVGAIFLAGIVGVGYTKRKKVVQQPA
jgi:hypothetical protein